MLNQPVLPGCRDVYECRPYYLSVRFNHNVARRVLFFAYSAQFVRSIVVHSLMKVSPITLLRNACYGLPALLLWASTPATAQDTTTVTLADAVQIALVNNYALQGSQLDVAEAEQAVRGATSVLYPQIAGRSNYTRHVRTANPFAGSAAGDIFDGFAYLGWLQYNEHARTDSDPASMPITFAEYAMRQQQGLAAANVVVEETDNPFEIANQYVNTLSVRQTLLNLPSHVRLFGKDGIRSTVTAMEEAANRQEQLVIANVRKAFYGALMAQAEVLVTQQSVGRTEQAVNETTQRVVQGLMPRIRRLGMDVELANLQTALLRAQDRADDAMMQFKLLLGLPVLEPIRLKGSLDIGDASPYLALSTTDAYATALQARPDLNQATLAARYAENEVRAARLSRFPIVELFADLGYLGRVPKNRTYGIQDPTNPFRYSRGSNDYFSGDYWQSSVAVGFNLSWSIFSGFQRRSQIETAKIAASRAQLNLTSLKESIQVELESALRRLATAQQHIESQEVNVTNAEMNYEYLRGRYSEGLAGSLELLTASTSLDTSRLNYLAAVHDYLVAQSEVEIALGVPLSEQTDVRSDLMP